MTNDRYMNMYEIAESAMLANSNDDFDAVFGILEERADEIVNELLARFPDSNPSDEDVEDVLLDLGIL